MVQGQIFTENDNN